MRKTSKRLLSVVTLLTVIVCLFSGFAAVKPVNADIGGGGPNIPPHPPISILSKIQFASVGLAPTSFPQGSDSTILGRVKNVQYSVNLKVTLKKYYNSYSAYTVGTYTDTRTPDSYGNVYLSDSSIFRSQLNMKSLSTGHYVLVIEASEGIRTISTTLNFYVT